ncbi:MAG: IMP dehydrogenase [Planctomycetota bacterium]
MLNLDLREAITFDDVLLVPNLSDIVPSEVATQARFSRNILLNIPISSAAMDTVTEAEMAIAISREGGIGIIHKNCSIDEQVIEVDKVKRSANGIILDPITLSPNASISKARAIMESHKISGLPVVQEKKVVGIITNRDLRFQWESDAEVREVMTTHLVTAPIGTTLDEAKNILHRNKIEKLILVNDLGELGGLITMRDIKGLVEYPNACRDRRGKHCVGAAIGVFDLERCEALIKGGCDVLVVDTAHGHSMNVIETVKEIKKSFNIDVVAGNIATAEAARDLVDAGVDAVKIGIGPGSICTTRVVTGVGVPQLTAIADCATICKPEGIPMIADGGIRLSGDIVKALAAGADCTMIGSLFGGVEESPGETILYQGRNYKTIRGMGSLGAMMVGSGDRYRQKHVKKDKLVPEGVEGLVPHRGRLSPFIFQLVGGLRSGMGYVGASNLDELYEKTRFVRISTASLRENHPHDIMITKQAPNYVSEA